MPPTLNRRLSTKTPATGEGQDKEPTDGKANAKAKGSTARRRAKSVSPSKAKLGAAMTPTQFMPPQKGIWWSCSGNSGPCTSSCAMLPRIHSSVHGSPFQ